MDSQVRRAAHLCAVNARHQKNGNHRYCKSIHILSYKSTYLYVCMHINVYVYVDVNVYVYM